MRAFADEQQSLSQRPACIELRAGAVALQACGREEALCLRQLQDALVITKGVSCSLEARFL